MRELNDKYVKVSLKSTGRTFTGRDGTEKEETTILFEKLFADENACRADYLASKGDSSEPAPVTESAPVNGNGSKEKETAGKFLKVIVENAARGEKDLDTIRARVSQQIANMAPIAKFFTVDSPEVMTLVMDHITKVS